MPFYNDTRQITLTVRLVPFPNQLSQLYKKINGWDEGSFQTFEPTSTIWGNRNVACLGDRRAVMSIKCTVTVRTCCFLNRHVSHEYEKIPIEKICWPVKTIRPCKSLMTPSHPWPHQTSTTRSGGECSTLVTLSDHYLVLCPPRVNTRLGGNCCTVSNVA